MIFGIGIDLVEVARIDGILKKWDEKFTKRIFSGDEIIYCEKKASPSIHYAARFAAKEAFLKCLGSGIWSGLTLKDVEVFNNRDGKPELKLHKKLKDKINDMGITGMYISISHTDNYATAVVILEGPDA